MTTKIVMTAVPSPVPVTTPVRKPIVATEALLVDHTPKAVASVYETLVLTHAVGEPLIVAGVDEIFSASVI